MKPVYSRPDLVKLALLLEEYEEILDSHTQAKVVSLSERRAILQEVQRLKKIFIDRSKKALFR